MRGTPVLYFNSLNRHFYIFGVEKDLFFLNIGLCVPIAMSARFSYLMDIMAILLLVIGHIAGMMLTRVDPQMKKIYIRHIRYRKKYQPISGLQANTKQPKLSVPVYQGQRGLL